jgi:hypothetical protein
MIKHILILSFILSTLALTACADTAPNVDMYGQPHVDVSR